VLPERIDPTVTFHHYPLPPCSTLLAGRLPRDEYGFRSSTLQVWYNHTNLNWAGAGEPLHFHSRSDKCFIVLRGRLEVRLEDATHTIDAGEYCCFPAGQLHAIAAIHLPVQTLMLRAPSVDDKVILGDVPVAVEVWTLAHPRWPALQALIDNEGQANWVAFGAEWHQSSHVLAVSLNDEPAGFLRYVIQPIGPDMDCAPLRRGEEELLEAKVLAFGVAAPFRRRGLGRRLQLEAIRRARSAGCYQVRSRSDTGHAANHQLKLSLGFAAHTVSDQRGGAVYYVRPL
jgi:GNAT superfamily N-acetyltransferase